MVRAEKERNSQAESVNEMAGAAGATRVREDTNGAGFMCDVGINACSPASLCFAHRGAHDEQLEFGA